MSARDAFQASVRFGLGSRAEELREIDSDPRGWVRRQVHAQAHPTTVPGSRAGRDLVEDAVRAIGAKRPEEARKALRAVRDIYIQDTGARFAAQAASTQPVTERMVLFWSNHFTVSVRKPLVAGLVHAYEAEAIRPHVNGYFEDMLLAVARHPAMLFYLDNVQSFGVDSPVGRRRGRGINENMARELLELHTLGVDGGYTQDDVVALARIMTGWTLDRGVAGVRVRYRFQPAVHEPGPKTLLGRRFAPGGEEEGIEALRMLARHPATAHHLAVKLVRHYVADAPPDSAVKRLRDAFLDSGGYLPKVMETLLDLDRAWVPFAKLKNPYELALSAVRLTGLKPDPAQVVSALEALDYRAFNASSPAGFPDTAEAWASPDAVLKRIEWSYRFARHLPADTDPIRLAEKAVGPLIGPSTRHAIARAPSRAEGAALLLASPEFQRR